MTNKKNNKNKSKVQVKGKGKSEKSDVLIANLATYSKEKHFNEANIQASKGKIRVRNEEYIADISGSSLFSIGKYPMNPGMSQTFPWLSNIANKYESYRFLRLRFIFRTESSALKSGSIMLAPDYNASDPTPVDKQHMLQYDDAARGPTWDEKLVMECKRDNLGKRRSYYIRDATLQNDQDIKTYDTGSLYVATKGQIDSSDIGELWVEYDVELSTPQTGYLPALDQRFTASGATKAAPFYGYIQAYSKYPILQVENVGHSGFHVLRGGEYLMSMVVIGTSVNNINFTTKVTLGAESGANSAIAVLNSGGSDLVQYLLLLMRVTESDTINFDFNLATTVSQTITRLATYAFSTG